MTAEYNAVARHLIAKARLRGVNFVLPVDVLVADELIRPELKRKCFDTFDADSRDEGADYDGEIKSVFVGYPPDSPASAELALVGPYLGCPAPANDDVFIRGFIYDIGEASRKTLQATVAASDLLLVWGTVGVCEVSGFQMGQRAQ